MGAFGLWSAYGSFGRTIRLLFFSTLLAAMSLSFATFGYGCWTVFSRAQYAELLHPSLYVDVARIMIVVSVFALINACVSIWAITREMRCVLYSYIVANLVIFVMLFIGGIMGFIFRQQILLLGSAAEKLRKIMVVHYDVLRLGRYEQLSQLVHQIPLNLKMLTSLRELYGTPEMEDITNAWDELQRNVFFKLFSSREFGACLPNLATGSTIGCATSNIQSCLKVDIDNPNSTLVYTSTCYLPLQADLLTVMQSAAWLAISCSIIILIPSIFAAIYAKLIKK